ncbi:hypothetical protein AURDEDRAFT_174621 [Auricularia subglabra TFB-10046 SS5]|uniref:Uncharacterized protein n=1 Tax=Auricularia subglabra (strain TFB-10046 / SS5) TaxID=717982 RepID=J0LFU0_AURST|nr:hypothetical protein AURDEDRAFT_174621 [Auricularia subglabra TFB-10046 SS5]
MATPTVSASTTPPSPSTVFLSRGEPMLSDFRVNAGGLNAYPLPSMLPLAPENNYTRTILFCCSRNVLSDKEWRDYRGSGAPTAVRKSPSRWSLRAPSDSRALGEVLASYEQDDIFDARMMGRFVTLPDRRLFMINYVRNCAAGYRTETPFIQNIAPLEECKIAQLYYSSAILLPDGPGIIAGLNAAVDSVHNVLYLTTYNGIPPAPVTYGAPDFNLNLSNELRTTVSTWTSSINTSRTATPSPTTAW